MKNTALGECLEANTALGFASCCISLSAHPLVLYFSYSTHGGASTKTCCIVLYCIVLYFIVLCCIVLYCVVLYCIVLYCIVLKLYSVPVLKVYSNMCCSLTQQLGNCIVYGKLYSKIFRHHNLSQWHQSSHSILNSQRTVKYLGFVFVFGGFFVCVCFCSQSLWYWLSMVLLFMSTLYFTVDQQHSAILK